MVARPHVVVIGGGISGLATAYQLLRATNRDRPESANPPRPDPARPGVTVFEAAPRLGGKIMTQNLSGLPIDAGPDTIAAQSPQLSTLIAELGLADTVVSAAAKGNYLWARGRLRRVPAGGMFGLSERPLPLLRAGLLSPVGVLRAGLDLVLPRAPRSADPSVGELLRPRFGDQVCDRLVEPMLSGAHAGRLDLISARSTVPEIESMAREHRSLYLALRQRHRKATAANGAANGAPAGPTMNTLDGGLTSLVDALAAHLTDVRLGTTVTAVEPSGAGYLVRPSSGPAVYADAVVFAVPAYVTANLLQELCPDAATALREVSYVDIASVTLGYPRSAISRPLDATGFLVPPAESRLLVGCTWLSAKWPHLSGHPITPIRCLVGANGDPRWSTLDDQDLIRLVHQELVESMGLTAAPEHTLVQRWPRAIPQYTVGHQDRLNRIDAALAALPGLHLTGAAYRGASLARCVAQAAQIADTVVATLNHPTDPISESGSRLEHVG